MNYYNEIDPQAAQWLRNLISAGLIPPGDVDERSIEDVVPNELRGYVQHHFFAGIGGWSLALDIAGWPRGMPVITGSCPCQPFSTAGKSAGFADQRHLWPAWFHIIRELRPTTVFGEQVSAAIRFGWLDLVQTDLEGSGYAVGAAVLGAHSVGGHHVGNRLYWVASSDSAGRARQGPPQPEKRRRDPVVPWSFAPSLGTDGRVRPIDPRPYGVGYGVSERVALNRAYGNAITPQVAAAFISTYMSAEHNLQVALT